MDRAPWVSNGKHPWNRRALLDLYLYLVPSNMTDSSPDTRGLSLKSIAASVEGPLYRAPRRCLRPRTLIEYEAQDIRIATHNGGLSSRTWSQASHSTDRQNLYLITKKACSSSHEAIRGQ